MRAPAGGRGPYDFNDTNSQGTHCAGAIFGRGVNGTRIGVAPGITRAVIGKVLGPSKGSTGTLFTAINWAIEGKAQVISRKHLGKAEVVLVSPDGPLYNLPIAASPVQGCRKPAFDSDPQHRLVGERAEDVNNRTRGKRSRKKK